MADTLSESTWFLEQPRVVMWMLGVVRDLTAGSLGRPADAQNGCGPTSPSSSSSSPGCSTGGHVFLITHGWASMMARTGL